MSGVLIAGMTIRHELQRLALFLLVESAHFPTFWEGWMQVSVCAFPGRHRSSVALRVIHRNRRLGRLAGTTGAGALSAPHPGLESTEIPQGVLILSWFTISLFL